MQGTGVDIQRPLPEGTPRLPWWYGAACDRRGEGGAEQQLRPEELRKQKRLLQLFHKRLQTFCGIGRGDRLSAVVQVDKDVFVMAHAQLFHVG